MLLHAGPPIPWTRMCGPMQGAIVGAIVWEGWAQDDAGARKLVESGAVRCEPCHDHGAVGPMAGIISPSMPLWIVRNGEHGHRTFSNLNEGLGKALSSGRRARSPGPSGAVSVWAPSTGWRDRRFSPRDAHAKGASRGRPDARDLLADGPTFFSRSSPTSQYPTSSPEGTADIVLSGRGDLQLRKLFRGKLLPSLSL